MADGKVIIAVDWDDSEIDSGIKQTKKTIEKQLDDVEVKAEVVADDGAVKELQNSLDKLDNVEITADVNVDDSGLTQVTKQLDDLDSTVTAKVDADTSGLDQAQKQIDDLKGEKVVVPVEADTSGFDLGTIGAAGAVAGVIAITEATKEYNEDLAKLETNATLAGQSFDGMRDNLKDLNAITGETDSNVEALSNLMQAGLTGNTLDKAVHELSGAVIAFPDTVKIESLADSLQETIATGAGIGQFSEVIERSGESLDDFNVLLATGKGLEELEADYNAMVATAGVIPASQEAIAASLRDVQIAEAKLLETQNKKDVKESQLLSAQDKLTTAQEKYNKVLAGAEEEVPSFDEFIADMGIVTTEAERQKIALDYFEDLDFGEVTEQYREQNEEMIANRDAQFELNDALATMGEEITPLLTPLVAKFAEFITLLVDNKESVGLFVSVLTGAFVALKAFTIISSLVPIFTALVGVIKGTTTATAALNAVFAISPIGLLVIVIGALVAGFIYLWNTSDEFRQFWIDMWEAITAKLTEFDAFLQGVFATDWTETFGAFGEVLNAFFYNVETVWNAAKLIFTGIIDFIKNVFTGNWEGAWEAVKQIFKGIFDAFVGIAKAPINLVIGLINGLTSAINVAIEGLNNLNIDVPDWVKRWLSINTENSVNILVK